MQQLSGLDTQFLAIENSTTYGLEGGHCAFMTRIHHALVDGMSGAEIMGNLYDLSPEGRELEPTPDRVDFGIVADREQMPDLRDLVESARVALDELDALVDA